ncbi:MAG TPA: archaemetzincin family Zn-dependent metalloprotease [Dissulfurispiraceae bacterium]
MTGEIKIIPCGSIDEAVLSDTAERIRLVFGSKVTVDTGRLHYRGAVYNQERGQYPAQEFLDFLVTEEGNSGRVLCITDADLYLPGLNYIFGLADEFRPVALVSTARLKRGNSKVAERVAKTAIHELGHTYGLQHCCDHKCVMFFSYTLSDTDYKGKGFCTKCRKTLEKKLLAAQGTSREPDVTAGISAPQFTQESREEGNE